MSKLPTRIRVSVRDEWDKEDSDLQKALSKLSSVLGPSIKTKIDWPELWEKLGPHYPEAATFVPTISRIVQQWCEAISRRVDNEASFEDWVEKFSELIGNWASFELCITLPGTDKISVSSSSRYPQLEIGLPLGPPPSYGKSAGDIEEALENLFESPKPKKSKEPVVDSEDSWTAVGIVSDDKSKPKVPSRVTALPTLKSLARPDYLFRDLTPYYLNLMVYHGSFVVEGSHEPSLELIADYFRKWSKNMPNLTIERSMLKIELQSSNFGVGHHHDSVRFERHDSRESWVHLNPTHVLAFIDGVLGYTLVYEDSSSWHYRRNEKYAS